MFTIRKDKLYLLILVETPLHKETDKRNYKEYRKLVNRSRQKLMNSVLHDVSKFKAKTRLQRRKVGSLRDKFKVGAVGYKLMDIQLLQSVLGKSCICKFCKSKKGQIIMEETTPSRKGLAECLIFTCTNCKKETCTFISRKVQGSNPFDVNIRSTYASLPFGREGLSKFCEVMGLPPPVLPQSYLKATELLATESEKLAQESTKDAAQRLINITCEKDPDNVAVSEDSSMIANVKVSVHGTCQKGAILIYYFS